MIGKFTLEMLCQKYGLNTKTLINKNNNILEYGEYKDIDATLGYLINELYIAPSNIEKCPNILYRSVNSIRENVTFLKKQNISFNNIETCLHVLSTVPNNLMETYYYVRDNYGESIINRLTSILTISKTRITSIENLNIPLVDKVGNLSIAIGINTLEEIQKIIQSPEFKEYPELFTFTTIGHAKLKEIQKIIQSAEFKSYPELFTSSTLACAKFEEIQKIIQSAEFKSYPELFTSTTLAKAKFEEIQKIIESAEFKSHPELFTSETLAHAKLEDIQKLLNMKYWEDERFKKLLTSTIVAKSKKMLTKIPVLIQITEYYGIDRYLNTNFLINSPSQDYALIEYLNENNIPLIINEKLNPIFSKQPGVLRKKYNIDINELITRYPLDMEKMNLGEKNGRNR